MAAAQSGRRDHEDRTHPHRKHRDERPPEVGELARRHGIDIHLRGLSAYGQQRVGERSGGDARRWLAVIWRDWDGWSATDGGLVPADAASTLLNSRQAFVNKPPDAPLLSVMFVVSRTVAVCGFLIGFGDPSRLGPWVVVCLQ